MSLGASPYELTNFSLSEGQPPDNCYDCSMVTRLAIILLAVTVILWVLIAIFG